MIHGQAIQEETTSPVRLDPFLKLCAAVAKRAVLDLSDPDPVTALDALDWFLEPDAAIFLQLLGFAVGQDEAFYKVVLNG